MRCLCHGCGICGICSGSSRSGNTKSTRRSSSTRPTRTSPCASSRTAPSTPTETTLTRSVRRKIKYLHLLWLNRITCKSYRNLYNAKHCLSMTFRNLGSFFSGVFNVLGKKPMTRTLQCASNPKFHFAIDNGRVMGLVSPQLRIFKAFYAVHIFHIL